MRPRKPTKQPPKLPRVRIARNLASRPHSGRRKPLDKRATMRDYMEDD